ncbi:glucans biosynthesis glucosyltransferase MdoH [Roseovarius rhodophyticola]|uniref:Glucans biosynthesis glucosyltransferase H n=1 Tax=Roseovarius rhodophyticola TaxID=3080827 RepID=A0ABZ2TKN2_9RHOB|nr:glucans biosynthesis glucosyltransferase MdoH [Roseovarius sp. W115]MDV2928946.1 glucans biosynthesis glucosyltransferase MdoH [Roseovarius sp. W115]
MKDVPFVPEPMAETVPLDGAQVKNAPDLRLVDTGDTNARAIRRRRLAVLTANVITVALLFGAMTTFLSFGGLIWIEWAMLVAYALTLPWLSIGMWNALLGLWLDLKHSDQAAVVVNPALGRITGQEPIATRIAVVMPLRNEDPAPSLHRLRGLQDELAHTPWAKHFDFYVLSDTDNPAIALREEAGVAQWRRARPEIKVHYHRRSENTGYKAGNIAEFLDRSGAEYDFFLPLDADSVMGAETVLRLVRVMQVSPEIGMLQSLVTGLPSKTFFTRAFQFGMRHGMRSYTLGAAWWQADCGPNWGHNILIRTAPFHAHCMLPKLPGKGPLSGYVLSHDQLEAALMRRAGFETRVLAEESDSHEENPPSLADFIRRELRWCNGNMQYFKLLGLPGLTLTSRVQLYLAIQMYLAAPAWMLFVLLGAGLAAMPAQVVGAPLWFGLSLFAIVLVLNLMPKMMGLAQILVNKTRADAYGGRRLVSLSGLVEILVSMLMAPIVAFGLSVFVLGLFFNHRVGWDAQQRHRDRLEWTEAARVLWPQTLAGLALTVWLAVLVPWALIFGAPMLIALSLAIPIAVVTTLPKLSRWSISNGLFDIPEDRQTDSERERPLKADIA